MNPINTHWQPRSESESQAHGILSQLVQFVLPESRFIAYLPFPAQNIAAQLHTCGKAQSVFALSHQMIDQNFILDLLQTLSGLGASKSGNGHNGGHSEIGVHLFGAQFHESFTSKLGFLKLDCKLYHVSISRSADRDIILVRDFHKHSNPSISAQEVSGSQDRERSAPSINPLSPKEISEFTQFGAELRKLRESN